jgi:hypothetical protein
MKHPYYLIFVLKILFCYHLLILKCNLSRCFNISHLVFSTSNHFGDKLVSNYASFNIQTPTCVLDIDDSMLKFQLIASSLNVVLRLIDWRLAKVDIVDNQVSL